jgi:16S rRNA (guanine(966)-N(2))-methyltransferase RsmD
MGKFRIIGGKFGGRSFQLPKGLPFRPTTDRTKESLFNILSHQIDFNGLKVLDLFGGTGNVSLEFISRGAGSVTIVERDARVIRAVKEMIDSLGVENISLLREEVSRFVARETTEFDVIFMDPPYDMPGLDNLIRSISEKGLLKPDGLMILEHSSRTRVDHLPDYRSTRIYGSSAISFFGRQAPA